jgi:hypothetical protein
MDVESQATLSAVVKQLTDSLEALQQKTVGDLESLVGKAQDRWRDETITPVLEAVAGLHSDVAALALAVANAEALLERITAAGLVLKAGG